MSKINNKGVFNMIQIFQEAALPKLSQTSMYTRYNQSSGITEAVKSEFATINEHIVKTSDIQEVISLMKLNGDAIIKKAIAAWDKGDMVVIFNPQSKIPSVLPYIIAGKESPKVYVFADKLMTKLTSTNEYVNLMAGIEAAYIALCMQNNPNKFINNRDLMLSMAYLYQYMAVTPLETKLYMKGDNLVKAMLYMIAYFYKIVDGDKIAAERINYKRLINQKIDPKIFQQIVEDVKNMGDTSFLSLLELIKKINPVRYKDINNMYVTYFVQTCGMPIIFALENPTYLVLLLTSASYKTRLTQFGLNKLVGATCKKINVIINGMV